MGDPWLPPYWRPPGILLQGGQQKQACSAWPGAREQESCGRRRA